MPGYLWKLQKQLRIGKEKKLRVAQEKMLAIVMNYISMKIEKLSNKGVYSGFNVLHCFFTEHEVFGSIMHPEEAMRDSLLAFIFGAQDTTSAALSWFFYLLSRKPLVEMKIR